jgi:hypothetical protein
MQQPLHVVVKKENVSNDLYAPMFSFGGNSRDKLESIDYFEKDNLQVTNIASRDALAGFLTRTLTIFFLTATR